MGTRAGVAVAVAVLLAVVPLLALPPAGPLPRSALPSVRTLLTDAVPVPARSGPEALPGSMPVRLTLTLAPSNQSRLGPLLDSLEDPASAQYRHFLSTAEFRAEFGPVPGALSRVESSLRQDGGRSVTPTPGDLGVQAVLPASSVNALLGVRLVEYRLPGNALAYSALGTPTLPRPLQGLVTGVGGLSDAVDPLVRASLADRARTTVPDVPSQFLLDNSTSTQWALGSDFAQAYHVTDLWPGGQSVSGATYPYGVAIATLLASGYNSTLSEQLPPWDPRVVDQYFNDTLGPGWPHPNVTGVPVTPAGAPTPPDPGSYGAEVDSSGDEVENSLDLEMAGSLAPGASLYNFYFAGSLLAGATPVLGSVADDLADDLAAALSYDYGSSRLAVVSASFGLPELNDSLWDTELQEAATTGVTVVCASGDQGDAPSDLTGTPEGPGLLWPASAGTNSTGAISVGGVTVVLSGRPTSYVTTGPLAPAFDPNVTGLASMTAWYETGELSHVGGSEGGISAVYPEPYWQFHSAAQPAIVAAAEVERVSALGRAAPDVALPANNTIAYVFANATGTIYLELLGGTSVAAPLLAGMLGSVVAVENATEGRFGLGFVTPELYRIASFYASASVVNSSAEASDPFLDVYNGSNYLFTATRGWDAVTGWGGLNATAFLAADENVTVSGYEYSGPTPRLPSASSSPPSLTGTEILLLISGVLVVVAAATVIVARPRPGPPVPPPGALMSPRSFGSPPVGPSPYSTFLCPYCGAVRPSEPVRCPRCGTL